MIHARRSRSGNIMRAFCIAHYRICTRDVETSTPPRAALSLEERPSSLTGARRRAAEELAEATAALVRRWRRRLATLAAAWRRVMGSAPYRIDAGVLLFFGGASLARSLSLVGPPFLEIRLCNINKHEREHPQSEDLPRI